MGGKGGGIRGGAIRVRKRGGGGRGHKGEGREGP